jgi:hypothetical protein
MWPHYMPPHYHVVKQHQERLLQPKLAFVFFAIWLNTSTWFSRHFSFCPAKQPIHAFRSHFETRPQLVLLSANYACAMFSRIRLVHSRHKSVCCSYCACWPRSILGVEHFIVIMQIITARWNNLVFWFWK